MRTTKLAALFKIIDTRLRWQSHLLAQPARRYRTLRPHCGTSTSRHLSHTASGRARTYSSQTFPRTMRRREQVPFSSPRFSIADIYLFSFALWTLNGPMATSKMQYTTLAYIRSLNNWHAITTIPYVTNKSARIFHRYPRLAVGSHWSSSDHGSYLDPIFLSSTSLSGTCGTVSPVT